MSHRRFVLAVLVAGSIGRTATGQAQGTAPAGPKLQSPIHGEQVSVSEVLLDVVVTGRDGRPVLGLGPDDFRVELDGKEVTATAASFYSNRRYVGGSAAARAAGVDPEDDGTGRIFVLFFHDQKQLEGDRFSFVGQQLEAGRRAARWLAESLAPGDLAAVVTFDSRLKVYQDLTADREALRRAALAAVAGGEPAAEWPSRRTAAGNLPSLLASLPSGTQLRDKSPRIYEALQLVADALAPVRGRKNLILFSRGFGDLGGFGDYRPDPRYYPPTRDALNAANVAVYGINTGPEPGMTLLDAVSDLANDTGGELFRIFVTFTTPLERIAEATNGYYLLALPAPSSQQPGRTLPAKVSCRNPELQCTARKGFRASGG